ncbi:SH3 domain-containing protein [Histidinibacterium aquaticum]|uniref:Aspartyl-trna synthetase n=1 Tax=Histidinibacterium aquaticum TaxID=2613962 RepID=A0A5J5GQ29_9RHOB|nr:SH3 domain-containing protein [Histidinibacterium aquaticum]KAA9010449.1 aspartyl-trna synthetase [Histidinibacterium aquaticum]
MADIFRLARIVGLVLLTGTASAAQELGPVTNFPLPRFVSLKASEGNLRRGPSLSHRIDWVLTRRNMPLRITAEYGHWRRVVDRDGVGGWVHYSLLSGTRTALVEDEIVSLYSRPEVTSVEVARLERGVVARIEECEPDWCRLSAGGHRGWAPKGGYWGVEDGEVLQ